MLDEFRNISILNHFLQNVTCSMWVLPLWKPHFKKSPIASPHPPKFPKHQLAVRLKRNAHFLSANLGILLVQKGGLRLRPVPARSSCSIQILLLNFQTSLQRLQGLRDGPLTEKTCFPALRLPSLLWFEPAYQSVKGWFFRKKNLAHVGK